MSNTVTMRVGSWYNGLFVDRGSKTGLLGSIAFWYSCACTSVYSFTHIWYHKL